MCALLGVLCVRVRISACAYQCVYVCVTEGMNCVRTGCGLCMLLLGVCASASGTRQIVPSPDSTPQHRPVIRFFVAVSGYFPCFGRGGGDPS